MNALGFYSKRNDGRINDTVWFLGTVFYCRRCASRHLRFVPEKPGLRTVEVEEVVLELHEEATAPRPPR